MALSGAVAGLAGVAEVMGYRYRYLDSFSSGWGFTGIAAALLGRNNLFRYFSCSRIIRIAEQSRFGYRHFIGDPTRFIPRRVRGC